MRRRLGCHPASDFRGFPFRVSSRHYSLQTTKGARHVSLASRQHWLLGKSSRFACVVEEIQACISYDLCSDLMSPQQEISECITNLVLSEFSFLCDLTLRARAFPNGVANAFDWRQLADGFCRVVRAGCFACDQIGHFDLLRDISLASRLVFLQRAAALGYFLTNAAFAIKVSAILPCSANSKFS